VNSKKIIKRRDAYKNYLRYAEFADIIFSFEREVAKNHLHLAQLFGEDCNERIYCYLAQALVLARQEMGIDAVRDKYLPVFDLMKKARVLYENSSPMARKMFDSTNAYVEASYQQDLETSSIDILD
jgi:hypothetical protein